MTAVQLPAKLYFRIGEVARILGVPTHVLRFWETEFRAVVRPQKSRAGQRVYSRKDVERLALIRHLLKEERYTIEGAKKHLREKGFDAVEEPPAPPSPSRAELLRDALVGARAHLSAAMQQLTRSAES